MDETTLEMSPKPWKVENEQGDHPAIVCPSQSDRYRRLVATVVETSVFVGEPEHRVADAYAMAATPDLLDAVSEAIAFLNMEAQRSPVGLDTVRDDLRQKLCVAYSIATRSIITGNLQRVGEIRSALAERGITAV